MRLTETPFFLLGATTHTTRDELAALVEGAVLRDDDAVPRDVRAYLLTPRRRLAAEVAWLPGVSPAAASAIAAELRKSPSSVSLLLGRCGRSALPRLNLLVEGVLEGGPSTVDGIARSFSGICDALDALRPDTVLSDINTARQKSGVPPASPSDVERAVDEQRRFAESALRSAVSRLSIRDIARLLTRVLTISRSGGASQSAMLLGHAIYRDHLSTPIDEAQAALVAAFKRVREWLKSAGAFQEDTVDRLYNPLVDLSSEFVALVAPAPALEYEPGEAYAEPATVAAIIRGLVVELHNKYPDCAVEHALRLTRELQEVFPSVKEFAEDLAVCEENRRQLHRRRGGRPGRGAAPASTSQLSQGGAFFWVCAAALGMFILWANIDHDGGSSRPPAAAGRTSSPPRPPAARSPSTYRPPVSQAAPAREQPNYVRPTPAGTDALLGAPQIRWCLREDAYIETWRPMANTNPQIAVFNRQVENYNRLCGSYRYYESAMSTARADTQRQMQAFRATARANPPW